MPAEPFSMQGKSSSCYVIRGVAGANDKQIRNWIVPSETQIDAFFGVSGAHWTPSKWRSLNGLNG